MDGSINKQGSIGADTAVVLFLLAAEYGRSVVVMSAEGLLMGVTMSMVLVLPYLLPAGAQKAPLVRWLLVRTSVAVFGIAAGSLLGLSSQDGSSGVGSLTMTLLILASMVSCYIQFFSLFKLRPVK